MWGGCGGTGVVGHSRTLGRRVLPGWGSGFRLGPSLGLGRPVCTLARRGELAPAPRALTPGPLGARPLAMGVLSLLGAHVARAGVYDRVWGLWGWG